MRFLLCGGGTAGHVMPAIAIAEIIEKEFKNAEIAFAGRTHGDENRAYIKTGRRLFTIDICGLQRSISITNIKSVFKIIKSGRNARRIIKDFHPDIIIGTGGYVCYPFIRQGQRLKIKTVLHESNVLPGLVTRILGSKCDRLLLNIEETKNHLRHTENVVVVGNPTRNKFSTISKAEAKRRVGISNGEQLIISFGGSLGSEAMNNAITDLMRDFSSKHRSIRHIHSTGRGNYEQIQKKHPDLFNKSAKCRMVAYIDDMPTLLSAADLAITRSGAMTISELCECGTPSILIPSPNVTANHQYINAKHMQDMGAAELIEENSLTSKGLISLTDALLKDGIRRQKMSVNARKLHTKDTDKKVANALNEILSHK